MKFKKKEFSFKKSTKNKKKMIFSQRNEISFYKIKKLICFKKNNGLVLLPGQVGSGFENISDSTRTIFS